MSCLNCCTSPPITKDATVDNLRVTVDKAYYQPGDTVSGNVLLKVDKAFESTSFILRVEGYEKTRWFEDGGKKELKRVDKKYFFRVKVPLELGGKQINPGQYQLPFSFILPTDFPQSFDYSNPRADGNILKFWSDIPRMLRAKVKVVAVAECEMPGFTTPTIMAKAPVQVNRHITKALSPVVAENKLNIHGLVPFDDKGRMTLTATINKDAYYPAEDIHMTLQIVNQSEIYFRKVVVYLMRTVRLEIQGQTEQRCCFTCKLKPVTAAEQVTSWSHGGVRPGETQSGATERQMTMRLPSDLPPSLNRKAIICDYSLVVVLKSPKFQQKPTVRLPFKVFPAMPPLKDTPLTLPQDFVPTTVASPVQVKLPTTVEDVVAPVTK